MFRRLAVQVIFDTVSGDVYYKVHSASIQLPGLTFGIYSAGQSRAFMGLVVAYAIHLVNGSGLKRKATSIRAGMGMDVKYV